MTSETMNHAWNVVYADGNYYHTDITWDEDFVEMQSKIYDGVAIPFNVIKAYTEAKIMVWNGFTGLKPLCNA